MQQPVQIIPHRTPETLAPLIREKLAAQTVNIVEVGRMLLEARHGVPPGGWTDWLSQHFSMSYDTADRYTAAAKFVARHKLELRTVRNLGANLIYALAQNRHRFHSEVVAQILQEAEQRRIGLARAREIAVQFAERDQAIAAVNEQPEIRRPRTSKRSPELTDFDNAVFILEQVCTEPVGLFVDSEYNPDDLLQISSFLTRVANEIRKSWDGAPSPAKQPDRAAVLAHKRSILTEERNRESRP